MSQLQVQGVSKAYGTNPVLTDLDLTVADGSITALLGPSGSGKTTLLRLVAGFDQVDHGTIRIGDTVVDDGHRRQPPERRHLGYVPQDGALFPHLTVAANVGFGLSRANRHSAKVGELMEMVGLSGLERRYPDQLSGGQQQRVALARALAVEPELVLLDEPFSALDPTLRASIRLDVLAILRAAKTTAILVTHDQDEALSAADEVAVIHGGVVVQHAPPAELYAAPVDAGLARFLGNANFFDTTISGGGADTPLGRIRVAGQGVTAATAGPATVMLRPEQLEVHAQPVTGSVAGTVVQAEFHGHSTLLAIALDDAPGVSPVLALAQGATTSGPGTMVNVVVTGAAMAWLGEPTPAW